MHNSTCLIFEFFRTLSYTAFDNILDKHKPYDILYGYICYFDKFDRNGMYSSSSTSKELFFLCLCVLESLTLDKSKLYFVEVETSNNCLIANVNVYRYSNLIKTDNYFRTNCCLVINFKQNRSESK